MTTTSETPRITSNHDAEAIEAAAARFEVHPNPHPTPAAERAKLLENPGFGVVFADDMARISYTKEGGWHDRRIEPYAPISLDPAASVLHYGQEIFEGLKAYRHEDGSVWTFRPDENAKRFRNSARRLGFSDDFAAEDFIGSVYALVRRELDWVPNRPGESLYLRPFAFATEPFLGVRSSHTVEYFLIADPVGSYFAGGVHPVKIWVAQDYHRVGPGGTGAAKTSGNYAASLLPQNEAYEHGCEHVLFTDAATGQYLEELGGMNIAIVRKDGTVETPELTGTILPGITRKSLVQLIEDRGRKVVERRIGLAELLDGIKDGSVAEVFACGTAAVITPIAELKGEGFDVTVGDGGPGEFSMSLRDELTGIQDGKLPDKHDWLWRIA